MVIACDGMAIVRDNLHENGAGHMGDGKGECKCPQIIAI